MSVNESLAPIRQISHLTSIMRGSSLTCVCQNGLGSARSDTMCFVRKKPRAIPIFSGGLGHYRTLTSRFILALARSFRAVMHWHKAAGNRAFFCAIQQRVLSHKSLSSIAARVYPQVLTPPLRQGIPIV